MRQRDSRETKRAKRPGLVAVAKYDYRSKKLPRMPEDKKWFKVLIHTSTKEFGGTLSPYVLKDENGHLLENVWQFSKVYREVSAQRIPVSRWKPEDIVWEHPAEQHLDAGGDVTRAYWEWRRKGAANPRAVRYPNGFRGRHKCLYALWKVGDCVKKLDYIQARKQIYCGEYTRLAPKLDEFKQLKRMHEGGQNILLVEVDGPDPKLEFPPYDRISPEAPGLAMDEETVRMLVNDSRKPFGHGFVIAALLLDGAEWMQ